MNSTPSVPHIKNGGTPALDRRSLYLRRLAVEAFIGGNRGHLPSSISLIEILRVLYDDILRYRADDPQWSERDRCILSKGHGCLGLYALLADKGFFPKEILKTFCKPGSPLGGHPERNKVPGVETSSGALGHGLSIGVGMALAARIKKSGVRVFVVMGDGELDEGSVWEAALSAAKHHLGSLIAVIDYNKVQSYGSLDAVLPLEPLGDKFKSFGFGVNEVDGHNVPELQKVFTQLDYKASAPHAVICHTVKGKGFPNLEADLAWHHKNRPSSEEITALFNALGEN